MDKIDEERKQETDDPNERLRKANETITQNKVMVNTRIDQVQENNRIQIEGIQKEQENLVNLQKQTGERCDKINTTVNLSLIHIYCIALNLKITFHFCAFYNIIPGVLKNVSPFEMDQFIFLFIYH